MSDCGYLVEPKTTERNGRYLNDAVKTLDPSYHPISELTSTASKKSLRYKSSRVPASTYLMTEEQPDCRMPDGKLGLCGPSQLCYSSGREKKKDFQYNSFRSVCRYLNSNGKEVTNLFLKIKTNVNGGW